MPPVVGVQVIGSFFQATARLCRPLSFLLPGILDTLILILPLHFAQRRFLRLPRLRPFIGGHYQHLGLGGNPLFESFPGGTLPIDHLLAKPDHAGRLDGDLQGTSRWHTGAWSGAFPGSVPLRSPPGGNDPFSPPLGASNRRPYGSIMFII